MKKKDSWITITDKFQYTMLGFSQGVGKVQGAGAGWTGGKVRSPECRVRRAARQLTTSLVS